MNAGATWLDSSQQLLPGLPVTDLAGTIFRPPHFRARGGLTLSDKAFSLAAFLNHSASVTDNRRPAAIKLSGSTTLDLTGRLRLGAGTEVALSAQNVFNSKPEPIFTRSEEHTSELQSLMRNSYAVFCLKKKKHNNKH